MDGEKTHYAEIITNPATGMLKAIYHRTPEHLQKKKEEHLDIYAQYEPLDRLMFGPLLPKFLVIQCSEEMANRAIRTRLDVDDRLYKVLTGTTLFGEYIDGKGIPYLKGFPAFKQLFVKFGYLESGRKNAHEVISEAVRSRHQMNEHIWLMIPKSLERMASEWGPAFMNLEHIPFMRIGGEEPEGPVSTANPVAAQQQQEWSEKQVPTPHGQSDMADPPPIIGEPKEARKQERDRERYYGKH